jgi:hypothetical protein
MNRTDPLANYVYDLGKEIVTLARKAKTDLAGSQDPFIKGRQTAFYEVLSLIREQAVAFGIDDEITGLKGMYIEELLE